ncbi:MAG TPA: hypothetical protein VEK33_11345 [Terriglobales bacterium]|nr:hypothetical protein [Terriglobales bacterium]
MLDDLHDLKQRASELEDENRELREQLRFKSDDYGFHHPFYYKKARPEQPLCPKCFASGVAAPMGATRSKSSAQIGRRAHVRHFANALFVARILRWHHSRDSSPRRSLNISLKNPCYGGF